MRPLSTVPPRALLIALAAVALGLLSLFAGRGATVRGESMAPTLADGERLMVDTLTYRVRPPARGDLVVVQVSDDVWLFSGLTGGRYVKRVVALPGETVEIRAGLVLVDGVRLAEPYLGSPAPHDLAPTTVPTGALFVLGDNRVASDDSRTWGAVPATNVLGRAWLVLGSGLPRRLSPG